MVLINLIDLGKKSFFLMTKYPQNVGLGAYPALRGIMKEFKDPEAQECLSFYNLIIFTFMIFLYLSLSFPLSFPVSWYSSKFVQIPIDAESLNNTFTNFSATDLKLVLGRLLLYSLDTWKIV